MLVWVRQKCRFCSCEWLLPQKRFALSSAVQGRRKIHTLGIPATANAVLFVGGAFPWGLLASLTPPPAVLLSPLTRLSEAFASCHPPDKIMGYLPKA